MRNNFIQIQQISAKQLIHGNLKRYGVTLWKLRTACTVEAVLPPHIYPHNPTNFTFYTFFPRTRHHCSIPVVIVRESKYLHHKAEDEQ